MNILITGAFGFVGTNLSKAIKTNPNNHLIAVDVFKPEIHAYDEYFDWDSLNSLEWNTIDAIIHLAGKAHDTKNTTNDQIYFQINLGLTQEIFNYFFKSPVKKFVFFSSVKAVADKLNGRQLEETEIPNPQTAYGKSKLAAEKYILSQSIPADKKVYILRPCMIHGPGNKGNLNMLYKVTKNKLPWPLGSFENERTYTSIDNLTFIIKHILKENIKPGIYNVADDQPISTNRLIQLIATSQNKTPRILKFGKTSITALAKVGDILHLPLNSERLQKLTESYVVSNENLKKALNITRMPVEAEEGMKKTLASFD